MITDFPQLRIDFTTLQNENDTNPRKKKKMRTSNLKSSFFIDDILGDGKNSLSNSDVKRQHFDTGSISARIRLGSSDDEREKTNSFFNAEIEGEESDVEIEENNEEMKSTSPELCPYPENLPHKFDKLQPDLIASCRDQSLSIYNTLGKLFEFVF